MEERGLPNHISAGEWLVYPRALNVAKHERVAPVLLLDDVLLVVNVPGYRGSRLLDPATQGIVLEGDGLRGGMGRDQPVLHVPVVGRKRARCLVLLAVEVSIEVVRVGELRIFKK